MKFYQAEMHCHTRETSPCGRVPAEWIVKEYIKKGYKYVFITDHMNDYVLEQKSVRKKSWEQRVDVFLKGYRTAKKLAEGTELTVMLAMEATTKNHPSIDFLIYGFDEDFLYNNEFLYHREYEEFYDFIKSNGFLMFQAHPYRYEGEPIRPVCYDGIEIYNAHPRHDSRNRMAVQYAKENGLYVIAGSDVHAEQDIGRGGVMLPEGIGSGADFVQYVKEYGSPELIITFPGV